MARLRATLAFGAYEAEVERELFQVGHHNLGGMLVSGVVLMLAVLSATWRAAPLEGLLTWLVLTLLARGAALLLWLRHRGAAQRPEGVAAADLRRWDIAHLAVMGAMGLATGMLAALFVPAAQLGDPAMAGHNLFLTVAIIGSVAYAASGSGTHDLRACLLGIVLATAAMIFHVPAAYGPQAEEVIVLAVMMSLVMSWVAVKSHQTLVNAIRLRLANERLAREHAEAAARATEANRAKSEFLAAASHDLRQPVHALTLLVEALRREEDSIDAAGDAAAAARRRSSLVGRISEAAHAIGHLFNELMELSRLESERHPPVPVRLQPATLLAALVDRQQPAAQHKGLRLRLRIGHSAAAAWVCTDRVMLERILGNLLSNALRYTDRGGVLLTLRRRGPVLEVAVTDTGRGIAEGDQQRIFDPYVQLGNPERDRERGLGLGLAIVRQSALRLGLPLRLRSHVGRGSTFAVHLALAAADADPKPAPAAAAPADPGEGLAGRRVLLVEDDVIVRIAMEALLQSWRVDLRMARDGDDPALADCDREGWRPELVICDYRIPGRVLGIELLDELQERWPGCAALLQTGEPPASLSALAEAAGYPVLYKPVTPALLASTLRALLPARRSA